MLKCVHTGSLYDLSFSAPALIDPSCCARMKEMSKDCDGWRHDLCSASLLLNLTSPCQAVALLSANG